MSSDLVGRLLGQFGHPEGALGHLAGLVMSRRNRGANQLAVDLLEIGERDRVLDVGCGPGLAVAAALERAPRGFVVGADASAAMVAQARLRNRAAIRAGRAAIQLALAADLPLERASVDRAVCVNSLGHWPSAKGGLVEIARVLRPGGRLVVGLRRRQDGGGRLDRRRYGASDERIAELITLLETTGFRPRRLEEHAIEGEATAFLVALR
ncbi:MAG TPA: class I SAM-dependent methyltransferase [Myxococcota bacterium]|jgi:SAM-dependent methyltransferase|nr:class I SAM-dependent methyltransferase [Myxococcota bacterium]